jgi:mono/diheme cytochrome c family protein
VRFRGGAIALVALATAGCAGAAPPRMRPTPATITFPDVAPIFHRSCAGCHRRDGVAPFPLLAYDDVRAHAQEIADAVTSRFMPPWLPEPGHIAFHGDRRLTDGEIARIREWVAAGAPEGDRSRVPRPPELPSGWQLGAPDLIVRLPEPYPLAAGGREVFRNFVVPVPISGGRWVRAVEFRPGSRGRIHHATLFTDASGEARRLDALDPAPGYPGMEGGAATAISSAGAPAASPGRCPRDWRGKSGRAWISCSSST